MQFRDILQALGEITYGHNGITHELDLSMSAVPLHEETARSAAFRAASNSLT